jgi:hypothetical protein
LQIGEFWGYRELGEPLGTPLWRAETLQFGPKGSNKVRARVEGGEFPGLDRWVPRRRFRVTWQVAQAFVEDERRLEALLEFMPDTPDETIVEAVETVFDALPASHALSISYRFYRRGMVEIDRFTTTVERLGLDAEALLAEPGSFIDRVGTYYARWTVALRLGQDLDQRYRDQVLAKVAGFERNYRHKAVHGSFEYSRSKHYPSHETPAEFYQEWLAERLPVNALVRRGRADTLG